MGHGEICIEWVFFVKNGAKPLVKSESDLKDTVGGIAFNRVNWTTFLSGWMTLVGCNEYGRVWRRLKHTNNDIYLICRIVLISCLPWTFYILGACSRPSAPAYWLTLATNWGAIASLLSDCLPTNIANCPPTNPNKIAAEIISILTATRILSKAMRDLHQRISRGFWKQEILFNFRMHNSTFFNFYLIFYFYANWMDMGLARPIFAVKFSWW